MIVSVAISQEISTQDEAQLFISSIRKLYPDLSIGICIQHSPDAQVVADIEQRTISRLQTGELVVDGISYTPIRELRVE
jgi:hypothetical protein